MNFLVNITIKTKLYIILTIGTIGSLLVGYYINSHFLPMSTNNPEIATSLKAINTYIAVLIILDAIVVLFVAKQINNSVHNFRIGMRGFFDYLNNKRDTISLINITTNDELGIIAKEVNENAKQIENTIEKDKFLMKDLIDIIEKVNNGFYAYTIDEKSNNPVINEIIDRLNQMIKDTKEQISELTYVLQEYGKYNFEADIQNIDNMNGSFGTLSSMSKLIGNNVSEFLAMIINTGESLQKTTKELLESSSHLTLSANSSATSLEETAAALEEITSTISNNTHDVVKMDNLAKDVNKSVIDGLNLAKQTVGSMDEINAKINLITDSIQIIDQIAFQTNILSLNAAVEAATAGEAGKGFAVVAQEVRNLASRSAEAASEIKQLVEEATIKSNEGKTIANDMIHGYDGLNKKITDTINIIENVASASKEQEMAISQINDAIAQLDIETQKNALQASDITDMSKTVTSLSENLIEVTTHAKFKEQTKQQVCDNNLIFMTSNIKEQHIHLKEKTFDKVGAQNNFTITTHTECAFGKWIQEQEEQNNPYITLPSWEEMKLTHNQFHNSLQEYVTQNANNIDNNKLKMISQQIELNTYKLFEKLDNLKIENCNNINK